jgi:hypothetical protein
VRSAAVRTASSLRFTSAGLSQTYTGWLVVHRGGMWPGECDEKIQDRWENRVHILLPLACLNADDRWHQLLRGIPHRLQEEPLEVGRSALLLAWPFWQISHEGIAAIP